MKGDREKCIEAGRVGLHHQAGGHRAAGVAAAGLAVPVKTAIRSRSRPRTSRKLELDLLLEAVFRLYGYDFRDYARTSMRRRIANIMKQEGLQTISALQERVLHDRACWERFLNAASRSTSARCSAIPAFFLAFRQQAVPMLRTYPFIRIWHAGCSLGEEVYSLAILLQEEGLYDRSLIYATDINEAVLRQAREGIYPARADAGVHRRTTCRPAAAVVSPSTTPRVRLAILRPTLQRNIVFSQHNLVSDGRSTSSTSSCAAT